MKGPDQTTLTIQQIRRSLLALPYNDRRAQQLRQLYRDACVDRTTTRSRPLA